MTTEYVYEHLIESFNQSFSEITLIMKTLGNEKRLQILVSLLKGPQTFGTIVEDLILKKTAVSNHLSQMMAVNLINREGNGVYNITGDGLEFIKAIEKAYKHSPTRQIKKFESLQSRGISSSFLNRFSQP